MKILAVGDVVGRVGSEFFARKIKNLKSEKNLDLVIVNGENSAEGNGVTRDSANFLLKSGADVITAGNHVFRRHEIRRFLDTTNDVIRPANYPRYTTPGKYFCKLLIKNISICVINLLGNSGFNENFDDAFLTISRILKYEVNECQVKLVDFHAETTAEKRAMGYFLDGKVSAIWGTHTHVQTSDESILPRGTGYITDLGMTGPINSVLGVRTDIILKKFLEKLPIKFETASGDCKMECAIFDIDEKNFKTRSVEKLRII